jgi:general secretion pathway protein H
LDINKIAKTVNYLNLFPFSTPFYPLKGFTLIEIMVVLIIIGVVLSFVTLSVGNSGQTQLQQEAQRLASLLTLASQEAILQAKEFGVAFTPEGYRFYEWQGQKWQALNNDDLFHLRTLPSTIQLVFYLESEPLQLEKEVEQPQLLLLSSGEFTPFEVRLMIKSNTQGYYQLTGNIIGRINIQPVGF